MLWIVAHTFNKMMRSAFRIEHTQRWSFALQSQFSITGFYIHAIADFQMNFVCVCVWVWLGFFLSLKLQIGLCRIGLLLSDDFHLFFLFFLRSSLSLPLLLVCWFYRFRCCCCCCYSCRLLLLLLFLMFDVFCFHFQWMYRKLCTSIENICAVLKKKKWNV